MAPILSNISTSIRRRFSSNASTIDSPISPGGDDRRPTLPALFGSRNTCAPCNTPEIEDPLLPAYDDVAVPLSRHSSCAAYRLATHELDSQNDLPINETEETYDPFNSMARLCDEYGMIYPLERQGARHIDNVGGYNGSALTPNGVGYRGSVIECDGQVANREKRRISISRSVSSVSKRARKFSGDLGRRASKLLKMTSTPKVIRHGGRAMLVDEDGELINRGNYVSIGREVADSDFIPAVELNPIDGCFGEVQWPHH